jgi:hypothetical protein
VQVFVTFDRSVQNVVLSTEKVFCFFFLRGFKSVIQISGGLDLCVQIVTFADHLWADHFALGMFRFISKENFRLLVDWVFLLLCVLSRNHVEGRRIGMCSLESLSSLFLMKRKGWWIIAIFHMVTGSHVWLVLDEDLRISDSWLAGSTRLEACLGYRIGFLRAVILGIRRNGIHLLFADLVRFKRLLNHSKIFGHAECLLLMESANLAVPSAERVVWDNMLVSTINR